MELAAWLVRGVHGSYVAFVVTAPMFMWSGLAMRNRALASPWLGGLHLGCLAFVTLQLALGWHCPLSVLESRLRGEAAGAFMLPASWLSPSAVPLWCWLGLAAAIGITSASIHLALRQRGPQEPSTCSSPSA